MPNVPSNAVPRRIDDALLCDLLVGWGFVRDDVLEAWVRPFEWVFKRGVIAPIGWTLDLCVLTGIVPAPTTDQERRAHDRVRERGRFASGADRGIRIILRWTDPDGFLRTVGVAPLVGADDPEWLTRLGDRLERWRDTLSEPCPVCNAPMTVGKRSTTPPMWYCVMMDCGGTRPLP